MADSHVVAKKGGVNGADDEAKEGGNGSLKPDIAEGEPLRKSDGECLGKEGDPAGTGCHDFSIDFDEKDDEVKLPRFLEPVMRLLHLISPLRGLVYLRLTLEHRYRRFRFFIVRVVLVLLLIGYFVYLAMALRHRWGDEPSIRLVVVTVLAVLGIIYYYVKKFYGKQIYDKCIAPTAYRIRRWKTVIKLVLTAVVALVVLLFILIETSLRRPQSLVSVLGIVVFTLFMFFFSKDPREVEWRPVLWGMLLQLLFGIVVLRTRIGYDAFVWLGERVTEYLNYSKAGSAFIFGQGFAEHFFAFQVMPVLIFFSASIGILYYLGVIQVLIEKIAFVMQYSLGTGAMESLHAAVNIFVGWGEAIVIVRPVLDRMTLSELHTVMTNGFATVAGSTLAAYILYGASANHLLSASVMSAPAALAMSKLFYPEQKENRRRKEEECAIPKQSSGLMDAASMGAVGAISIVAHILASVVAFISLLAFVNATLKWFGERVGLAPPDYPVLSFELISSYLFWPVVFLMGVAPADCRIVGRMVGVKTFVNEFVAYEDLGRVRMNRVTLENYTMLGVPWTVDANSDIIFDGINVTLKGGVISPHSEMVATFALCGFSNVVALGIMIGALTAVVPSRKQDILRVSMRALVSGCMACFFTACVAGLLGES